MTIVEAMRDPALFANQFADAGAWQAWGALLKALFGEPLAEDEQRLFTRCTGRTTLPMTPAREAWLVVGRRGGKSRIAALVAVYLACFRTYDLAPGERGTLAVIAADRRQARTVMRYVDGLLNACPMLARMVTRRTSDAIEFENGIVLEVHTASFRTVRGYTVVAAVLDEIAFWRTEDAANPDREIVNALRPAMATVPGALLLAISSPYARRGVLWDAYRRYWGRADDAVLVWQAPTRVMNPTIPAAIVEAALAEDPAVARAEYEAEFRRDIEAFVSPEVIDAVTVPDRQYVAPVTACAYEAFVDPSGGAQDAMTLAIAHRDGERVVLDRVYERRPPFSPDAVVAEFATDLAAYGVTRVEGDRFGGEWPRERFRVHGIAYDLSALSKSDLYREFLPLLTGERVELLDLPRLRVQLCGLERRTTSLGRDIIDHLRGGTDDLANAVAGAIVRAAARPQRRFVQRQEPLAAAVAHGRRPPFPMHSLTLGEALVVDGSAFDQTTVASRAVHVAIGPQMAGIAIAHVRTSPASGSRPVLPRTRPGIVPPVFVVEAMVQVHPGAVGDFLLEELIPLVLDVRRAADVPFGWLTAPVYPTVGARQLVVDAGLTWGELRPDKMLRGYHELRAALYQGRLWTYPYPPFTEALERLGEGILVEHETPAVGATDERVWVSMPGCEVLDAVAGALYVLATRRESWIRPSPGADGGFTFDVELPNLGGCGA